MEQSSVTQMVNDCRECQAHDLQTRNLAEQLFSQEESTILVMMLAGAIQIRTTKLRSTSMSDSARIQERRALDIMGAMLGKLMISFAPDYARALLKTMRKGGVAINLQHERCPHKQEPDADPSA